MIGVNPQSIVCPGHYRYQLAPGIETVVTVYFQRVVDGVRFVRFRVPEYKLPAYASVDVFAKNVVTQ